VEFRQQAQFLSGTSTKFTSGQIVEQPLIVREPQTGKDLVTQIDRRTVGLSLNLRATAFSDGWHIEFDLSDSSLSQGSERTTTFVGQRRIKDADGFFLLTSFNRTVRDRARLEVPGFAKIPLVGKAFRKATLSTQNRSVMLLARPVLVQRASTVGGP
jgi:type II secretory pathway component GspD/PulD (secretin)